MNKRLHRKRNTRFKEQGWMPPHVVLHEEKQVLFLIESGMAYLAMGNFMKNFPDDYRGIRCRDKDTFRKYGGVI